MLELELDTDELLELAIYYPVLLELLLKLLLELDILNELELTELLLELNELELTELLDELKLTELLDELELELELELTLELELLNELELELTELDELELEPHFLVDPKSKSTWLSTFHPTKLLMALFSLPRLPARLAD